ncbi:MAG: adenylate/guanylate cyclase domain-containing protein [Calditrichia bacterium]
MPKKSIFIVSGIILVIFIVTLTLRLIPVLNTLELKTIDWRFRWRGPVEVKDSPIVLVTIDDQSFDSLPDRWPWPRYYYAHVIDNLTRAGARVIGLDVMLDTPDKMGKISDLQLAEAIRNSQKTVLAGKLEERISVGQISSFKYSVKPLPVLLEAGGTWGVIAIQADPDGIYRRYFVIQSYEEGLLPSFGLQVLKKYYGIPAHLQPTLERDSLRLGNIRVPLKNSELMMINFCGPANSFPSYSFDSVIDDERFDLGDYDLDYFSTTLLPEGVFRDKIVLIGSTVTELQDNFPTPFFEFTDASGNTQKAEMPGVEIHANAIWTILNNLYLKETSNWVNVILILFLIVITYLLVLRLPTLWSIILTIILIVAFGITQFILFSHLRLITEIIAPTLGIFLSFVASSLHLYVLTKKEKKMIIGAFERFVPEKVVKELLAHPEKLKLGGEERFLTVLFLDLAKFTSVAEKLSPADLVHLINIFLTEMTDIILKYDGIIDKYEGDAIMAEFGAPVPFPDHAVKACFAALEMQQKISTLDLSEFKNVVDRLYCRIGINSGNMIVGNMGSRNVFDYTVMGDAVNLASRLEGANKIYKTHIIISHDTYDLVKDQVIARPLDLIRVKGRQKPVRVFELIARKDTPLPENLKSMLPVFITGIRYYHHQEWKKAEECFRYCLQVVPEDGPSQLYLERIAAYSQTPPPENWDGVYTLQSK